MFNSQLPGQYNSGPMRQNSYGLGRTEFGLHPNASPNFMLQQALGSGMQVQGLTYNSPNSNSNSAMNRFNTAVNGGGYGGGYSAPRSYSAPQQANVLDRPRPPAPSAGGSGGLGRR
jgi:hypothetical protein